jgi:hypothetical protein
MAKLYPSLKCDHACQTVPTKTNAEQPVGDEAVLSSVLNLAEIDPPGTTVFDFCKLEGYLTLPNTQFAEGCLGVAREAYSRPCSQLIRIAIH